MTKKLSYKANHAKQMSYNLVSYYQEELYRDEILSLQILLSRTQSGPGRTVKQEQEEISPNHVQKLNLNSGRGIWSEIATSILVWAIFA